MSVCAFQGNPIALTLFRVYNRSVQGINDTQSLLHALCQVVCRFARHAIRSRLIAFKLKLVDDMAKVVVVLVFQVGDKVLERYLIRLVCSTGTEVEVADNL